MADFAVLFNCDNEYTSSGLYPIPTISCSDFPCFSKSPILNAILEGVDDSGEDLFFCLFLTNRLNWAGFPIVFLNAVNCSGVTFIFPVNLANMEFKALSVLSVLDDVSEDNFPNTGVSSNALDDFKFLNKSLTSLPL